MILNSPRLASSSLGLRVNFNPKQATRLGEFPCTPWLFSINSHAGEEEKRGSELKKQTKNAEEEEEKEKRSRGTTKL